MVSDYSGKLTARQELFVEAYVGPAKLVGAEAARLAGYSERNAGQSALQLLRRPQVQAAIRQRLEEQKLGPQQVVASLSEQARVSVEDFYDVTAEGEPVLNLSKAKDKLHLIKRITYSRTGKPELELVDSQKALELLARVHGLFEDRHTLSVERYEPYKVYAGFDPEGSPPGPPMPIRAHALGGDSGDETG